MLHAIRIPRGITWFFSVVSLLLCLTAGTLFFCSFLDAGETDRRLALLQEQYPPGSKFTGDYRGATECFGFAGYAFHFLYGRDMPNRYGEDTWYELDGGQNLVSVGQLVQKEITETSLKQLFSLGRPGDIIQYGTAGYPHTMVLLHADEDRLTVYDCNYDCQCTVLVRTFSCAQLASEIGTSSPRCGVTLYRASPDFPGGSLLVSFCF